MDVSVQLNPRQFLGTPAVLFVRSHQAVEALMLLGFRLETLVFGFEGL